MVSRFHIYQNMHTAEVTSEALVSNERVCDKTLAIDNNDQLPIFAWFK